MIVLILVAIACAADAYTTDAAIKRGGVEKRLAWLIGSRPNTLTCWLVIFAAPVAVCAVALHYAPLLWPLVLAGAIWRLIEARRNHGVQR